MVSTGLPTANGIGWFQIGVTDGDRAEKFYGNVFGWTFSGASAYRTVATPSARSIAGGLAVHGGSMPNHAIFCVVVDDVEATCQRVVDGGGTDVVPATTTPDGLIFAEVLDPEGNHLGVYRPRPGNDT
jgi:predicted enzyme related to lactoylglutathione lyase